MTPYRFRTVWRLEAPIEDVFALLADGLRWPEWWRGVRGVKLLDPGAPDGTGQIAECEWRSRIPYPVRFQMLSTRVEPPVALEGQADGDLRGAGRWHLSQDDAVTTVTYVWDVEITRPWLARMANAARPVVRWNHDVIMRWGGEGLARRLGCRLL